MIFLTLFFSLVILLSCVSSTSDYDLTSQYPSARAIYFLSNRALNSIVAVKVGHNGTLSSGAIIATGGAGASTVQPGTMQPVATDALSSTGSIVVFQDVLLAVNPGSDTISMFRINPNNPIELTMVGRPVDSQGNFPNSISVSDSLNQACVANTGTLSGVACFHISRRYGLVPSSPFRSFNLSQTNPPTALPATGPIVPEVRPLITSVSFSADSSKLFATITSASSIDFPGYLAVYPVVNGSVSQNPITSTPNGTLFMFSSINIPNTQNLFITDAGFGTAIVNVSAADISTLTEATTIQGEGATCWTTFSPYTKSVFVTDALVNRILELDVNSGGILNVLNLNNSNPGNLDIIATGDKIYALSPGLVDSATLVVVLDISAGRGTAKEVQSFQPKGLGLDNSAQGIAVYT